MSITQSLGKRAFLGSLLSQHFGFKGSLPQLCLCYKALLCIILFWRLLAACQALVRNHSVYSCFSRRFYPA